MSAPTARPVHKQEALFAKNVPDMLLAEIRLLVRPVSDGALLDFVLRVLPHTPPLSLCRNPLTVVDNTRPLPARHVQKSNRVVYRTASRRRLSVRSSA